ncbi:MAG: DUF4595 domain-containing protein [[Clostridium] fimetarium]|nr:DUF4595 domain-containing protein [Alistipes timonensis]MCM1404882.1 DUF4595 domain-containing protein [[Clostridium] fimetarium]
MRTFRLLGAMALCAMMVPALTSCGDDDDDKGGDGTGGVVEIEGERLSSVAGYSFDYDSKGRVTSLSTGYGTIAINYSKGTLEAVGSDNGADRYKVKFNDKGYISQLTSSWDETEVDGGDKVQIKGSGTITFSYNGSGNLTTVTTKMSETEKDLSDGSTEKYGENSTTKLTWQSGNMVKAVCKVTETEGRYKETYTETFDLDYSTTANAYRQNPFAISRIVNDDTEWNAFAACGLFGKGPKTLPMVVSEVDDDGYTSTSNVSYSLNSVGAISSERIGYSSYSWYYEDVDSRAVSVVEAPAFGSTRKFFVKSPRRAK